MEKIKTAASGIREKNYNPKPSYMACEYCPYNHVCPATSTKWFFSLVYLLKTLLNQIDLIFLNLLVFQVLYINILYLFVPYLWTVQVKIKNPVSTKINWNGNKMEWMSVNRIIWTLLWCSPMYDEHWKFEVQLSALY